MNAALRSVVGFGACCWLLGGCHPSMSPHGEEDPYITAFRSIRGSVALLTVDGKTPEYGTACVVKSDKRGSYLLTDEHVIAQATRITVQIGDRMLGTASVVMRDQTDDVALLLIKARDLPAVELGDSSTLQPGSQIGIAGYPIPDAFEDAHFGIAPSLYTGRIASIRTGILEVDVAVIPGDSGAPVFEPATGKVVAVGEARFDDERAIGLATPIDLIKRHISRFVKPEPRS